MSLLVVSKICVNVISKVDQGLYVHIVEYSSIGRHPKGMDEMLLHLPNDAMLTDVVKANGLLILKESSAWKHQDAMIPKHLSIFEIVEIVNYRDFQVDFELNIPFDRIHVKMKKVSYLIAYYYLLIEKKIEPSTAKTLLGIENPVIFDLLDFIWQQSKLDLSNDSERIKIYFAFDDKGYEIDNETHVRQFCDEYDMDREMLFDIMNQVHADVCGYTNRFVL